MEPIDFSAIFAASPGPYLLVAADGDYTILAVNDAYLAATLTTRRQLVGRALFDAFPDNPSDPDATGVKNLRASLEAVVRDRKPHRMAVQQYDIRRPDGSFEERHWSPINTPVLVSDGQTLACIIHHVQDVTEFVQLKRSELTLGQYARTAGERLRDSEQRLQESSWRLAEFEERLRTEAALRHSREQMEIVVKGANVGVWYCPLPFDRLIWDEKVKEHFHLPPDAEVTIDTFYDRLHPDDRERTRLSIEASIVNKQPYDIDYRTVSPDGRDVKWIRASGRGFYDDAGNPTRFDGITIDATERVRAERALRDSESRFRQLADAMPQMVWVTRPDGYHEYYNSRWYEFTGVPQGSTDGEGWNGMFHPDDRDRAWAAWRHSLATGEPYEVEYRLRHRSGEYRWTLGRALPIRDGGGAITRWFGTCTEIDAIKRLQQERERLLDSERGARAEAERAGRMKDEFLATLSHELRTPLNAILGWSQILAHGTKDTADLAEGLRTIERNARAQTQIIEDLLDMSRIISGKVRLDVQRVDLAAVVREAVATAKPSADAKGIRVQAVLDPHAGPVSGDPARLQQVMWNLLTNAVKFTPKGGRVQVLLERVNSHVELSVCDTGEGIVPEFLPHVFDRFRQADATTTRRHGGLGLGLSIVKQLVELHGGSVRAKSAGLGQGTTFTLSLPLTVIHPEPDPDVERHHPRLASPTATSADPCVQIEGVKVLVVDDEPDARGLVRRLLEDCQAHVITAGSAAEAVELVRTERPDVLLSDVGMPGEDGFALIRRVRALGPEHGGHVPSAALTAYARAEDRVKAILAGFQMHLAKPVEPAELIATVAGLAGRVGSNGSS